MAQDYLDYLMNGEPQPNAGYDPILKNRYAPAAQPPVKAFPASAFGVPAMIPSPASVNSLFEPKITPSKEEIPSPRMDQPKSAPSTSPASMNLKLKGYPGSKSLPWGSAIDASDAAIGVAATAKSDLENAGKTYAKTLDDTSKISVADTEQFNKPVIEEAEKYAKDLKELNDLYTKQIPAVKKLYDDASKTREDAYKEYQIKSSDVSSTLDNIDQDIANMPSIDTGRFWGNASTGDKILMAIGLAFASLTPAAAQGASNIISAAIDRDIDAQKTDLNKKLLGYKSRQDTAKSRLEMYKDKFKNSIAAEEATKADAYSKVILDTEYKMKGIQNQQTIINMKKFVSDMKIEQAKATANAENAQRTENQQIAATKAKIAGDAVNAGEKLANQYSDKAKVLNDNLGKRSALMAEELKVGIGDKAKPMSLSEKQRYDYINEGQKGLQDMRVALVKGGNTFSPVGENDYTIGLSQYAEAFGRLNSQGVINPTELINFKSMAPGWQDQLKDKAMGTNTVERKLKTMEDLFNSRMNTLLGK